MKKRFFRKQIPLLPLFVLAVVSFASIGQAQLAFIDDAWWTFQQDCNGDGCKAGTLSGDKARLNWKPGVTNCTGTLTVFEKVYYRPCGATPWTLLYTTPLHTIVGCRSSDGQSLDVAMGSTCACRDYKIEVYRNGQASPDYVRSSTNDVDLSQHKEQLLSQDYCQGDNFATCNAIGGLSGSQSADTTYCTKEPGEPNHAGNAGGKSFWFCWTATNSTPVTFDTIGSSFDTLLAVYTGSTVSTLTPIASDDDIAGWTNRQSRVSFTPSPGTTYHIAVDGYGGASGIALLNWNQSGAALPDLIFWGPAASPALSVRTFASTDCEVVEGCQTVGTHTLVVFNAETRNIGSGDLVVGNPATNSLFRWATCHQHYHFEQFGEYNLLDTNGNVVATGHKVGFCMTDDHPWSPTANQSAKYDCNYQGIQAGWADVYGASYASGAPLPCQYIDVTSVPPGSYIIQMTINPDNLITEANTANNTTLVPFSIGPPSCVSAPINDNFANAVTVAATPFTYLEFNNCASKETGEPSHAGNIGGRSVWFNWTPSANQTGVITTKGSNFDTLLAVYTGNTVSSLSCVASNDDIIFGTYQQSYVSFAAFAGVTYRIAVDGYNYNDGSGAAVGTVILNVNPAGNDDFANAFVLSGTSGTTNSYNIAASKEPFEPAHAGDVGGHSIWYNWTAPQTGPADFNTAGSTFDTTLAVYTGTVVTNLTQIASNDDDVGGLHTSRLSFYAIAGTTYRIAIDGFGGETGNVTLSWNMVSRLGMARLANGNMQITLTGVDWQRYTLMGSSNLFTWTTNVPTITMSGGSHQFINNPATNGGLKRQFYRSVRAP
ncbi:MAG: hypothetical protein QOJ40_953 [Verrucomicrobiota bacterium]